MPRTRYQNSTAPQSDFESQFHRVFEATECRTQLEFADFLEIKQSSISDAKRRRNVPADWLVKILDKKGISPEWIRTGQVTKQAAKPEDMPTVNITAIEYRPVVECTTEELLAELVRRAFNGMK